MDGRRQYALPRTGLSRNQHVGVGGYVWLETAEKTLQMHTMTYNAFAIAQLRVYAPQVGESLRHAMALQCSFDAEGDLLQVDWLVFGEVIVCAPL